MSILTSIQLKQNGLTHPAMSAACVFLRTHLCQLLYEPFPVFCHLILKPGLLAMQVEPA